MSVEVVDADGIYLYGPNKERFIDLVSGVSVSNLGHKNKAIIQAVKDQAENYMHLMVYGEYIQSPQTVLAKMLTDLLPETLNSVYFVNSGSEAVEGAMKLAKRYTKRSEIISFKNAYHGSTHGALSVLGDESFKQAFRPLLPDVKHLEFNNVDQLASISNKTACVIVEPIQAEAGVVVPENGFLTKLRKQCDKVGALLVFDEIQTGFGRVGSLFAFEKYKVVPDILLTAKALGGGMPLGAFIAKKEIMDSFKTEPVLGHITTFGGHPVSCAASIAMLNELIGREVVVKVNEKGNLFKSKLKHKYIKGIYGEGLLLAVQLENSEQIEKIVSDALKAGIITEWFLFDDTRFRISPPLTITNKEIEDVCERFIALLNDL